MKQRITEQAMICDCHAHVFGPVDRYPLRAQPGYRPPSDTWSDYREMLRRIGVGRAVLVQPSPYGGDHAALLDAMAVSDLALRGVALVDDDVTDEYLSRLDRAGFRAARFHLLPDTDATRLATYRRTAERVRPLGWHIEVYNRHGWAPAHVDWLETLEMTVVCDHFGMLSDIAIDSPACRDLLRLTRNERFWFKLSAPYRVSTASPSYADAIPLARALVAAAPHRCVWGSDWPHPNVADVPDDAVLIEAWQAWFDDAATRQRVLIDNPARLYGFDAPERNPP